MNTHSMKGCSIKSNLIKTHSKQLSFMILLCSILLGGCQSTYFSAMEKIGYEKRDILFSRVKDAKESQKDAQKEFQSAYEEFATLVNFDGGDLEKTYNKLKDRYDNAVERAEDVTEKRQKVESVGKALFKEWKEEITTYSNQDLKRRSQQQLSQTQTQFNQLVARLKNAESKIEPVLQPFHDRVLFLKHNLNAQAVNSMRNDNIQMQRDIRVLIEDMQTAIQEADAFIATMQKS